MKQGVVFNELEDYPARWLRKLYPSALVIRSDIKRLRREDLDSYQRVHLFAGIGGWEHALKLAGWPSWRSVWTGSCPCQPFSIAGRQEGEDDPRHLWPEFLRLIGECRPPTIFGEQVASPAGREWLSRVLVDLEALGYAVAGADLCAASVGSPHIRQRLYWVANSSQPRVRDQRRGQNAREAPRAKSVRAERQRLRYDSRHDSNGSPERMGNAHDARLEGLSGNGHDETGRKESTRPAGPSSVWDSAELIECADGKYRRVPSADPESSLFPLAYGVPARVGRLRAYGNAIVPPLAATFVKAFLDV